MARLWVCGWETGVLAAEPYSTLPNTPTVTGVAAIESTIVRTGSFSLKVAPASGAAGSFDMLPSTTWGATAYGRAYIRITSLPSLARLLWGGTIRLDAAGTLSVMNGVSVVGTSTTALTDTSRWYCVEYGNIGGTCELRIDQKTEVTGATAVNFTGGFFGTSDTVAATYTAYFDDVIRDNADFPGPGAVVLLKPTADSAGGTGWTLGTGTALGGNGFTAVDNTPPTGVADLAVGSDPKQIRNATSNANTNYDATMQTYSAAGVSGVVTTVWPVVMTAAPVTTSAKQGTVGVVSNPAITNVALGTGGTSGAFWSGVAAGTFPTGWKTSVGTLTASPSVTPTTAPVMRITQVTSSTRIAIVCFMGIYVDYTPAVIEQVPYRSPYPQLLVQ